MAFTLGMTVHLCMTYMIMLVPIALSFMQGHSGSAQEKKSALNYLDIHASNKH